MPRTWDRSRFAPWLLRELVQVNEEPTSRLCGRTTVYTARRGINSPSAGSYRPSCLGLDIIPALRAIEAALPVRQDHLDEMAGPASSSARLPSGVGATVDGQVRTIDVARLRTG